MRYLLYLPNPETVTYAECETADRFMKYLKGKGITEIESEPARFHLYQAPDNCRKYRLLIPETAGIDEIRETMEQVREAGHIWLGRNPLEKFFCLHGKNGRWIDCGMYLWRLEMGRKQAGVEYKENDTDFMLEMSAA